MRRIPGWLLIFFGYWAVLGIAYGVTRFGGYDVPGTLVFLGLASVAYFFGIYKGFYRHK